MADSDWKVLASSSLSAAAATSHLPLLPAACVLPNYESVTAEEVTTVPDLETLSTASSPSPAPGPVRAARQEARAKRRPQPFFTVDQKLSAVQRVDQGEHASDVARDVGVDITTVRRWRQRVDVLRQHRDASPLWQQQQQQEQHQQQGQQQHEQVPQATKQAKQLTTAALLEAAMVAWAWHQLSLSDLTYTMVHHKAMETNRLLCGPSSFQASKGWIGRFLRKNGIPLQRPQPAAANALWAPQPPAGSAGESWTAQPHDSYASDYWAPQAPSAGEPSDQWTSTSTSISWPGYAAAAAMYPIPGYGVPAVPAVPVVPAWCPSWYGGAMSMASVKQEQQQQDSDAAAGVYTKKHSEPESPQTSPADDNIPQVQEEVVSSAGVHQVRTPAPSPADQEVCVLSPTGVQVAAVSSAAELSPLGRRLVRLMEKHAVSADDVYRLDASTLAHKALPSARGSREQLALGRQPPSSRLSLGLCANAPGSHKLPLMLVGTESRPNDVPPSLDAVALTAAPSATYACSDDFLTEAVFYEWFYHTFIPAVNERHSRQRSDVILVVGSGLAGRLQFREAKLAWRFHFVYLEAGEDAAAAELAEAFKRQFRLRHIPLMAKRAAAGPLGRPDLRETCLCAGDAWQAVEAADVARTWRRVLPDDMLPTLLLAGDSSPADATVASTESVDDEQLARTVLPMVSVLEFDKDLTVEAVLQGLRCIRAEEREMDAVCRPDLYRALVTLDEFVERNGLVMASYREVREKVLEAARLVRY